MDLAICIPTFKRPALLRLLLDDLSSQTVRAKTFIVVDGDPGSRAVMGVLSRAPLPPGSELVYAPSNHSNLAYQRYLAYRLARHRSLVLYLDDDVRISSTHAVHDLLAPLCSSHAQYVGGTAHIRFPPDQRSLRPRKKRRLPPGSLTPAGHRVRVEDGTDNYVPVQWLSGAAMAFRRSALTRDCFSRDLFALTHIGCGMGEDTFLALRVRRRGSLYLANHVFIDHPNAAPPQAYPQDAFRKGTADAYSRRFLNDHFRTPDRPTVPDRIALARSWVGTLGAATVHVLRTKRRADLHYVFGYLAGVIKGLRARPVASRLTPRVDWEADAARALGQAQRVIPVQRRDA